MVPQWIIEQKRDGAALAESDIREFIAAYADGTLPDYQMSALAMAIFFRGMTFEETTVLTDAMMRSGDVLDFSGLSRPTADKHSTGGIGDKISIPLAPLVASAGVAVPMISGRGLGITGGTLDKLQSIAGYRTDLGVDDFRRVLEDVGCSIIGQTARLAPADRKLYALRDVTGTVQSVPLISASIMSKKLAEGAASLVLDVKCGSGAFCRTYEMAKELATTMIAIGRNMGRNMAACITAMDQPLGRTAGNALEIRESVETLHGQGPADVEELTLALGAKMLVLAGVARSDFDARATLRCNLASGAALEAFRRMVEAQGGDPRVADDTSLLPSAPAIVDVPAPRGGFVSNVESAEIGRIVLLLGGGRRKTDDAIDYSVGVDRLVKAGESVSAGDPLMRIHARTEDEARALVSRAAAAVAIADEPPSAPRLVYETL